MVPQDDSDDDDDSEDFDIRFVVLNKNKPNETGIRAAFMEASDTAWSLDRPFLMDYHFLLNFHRF